MNYIKYIFYFITAILFAAEISYAQEFKSGKPVKIIFDSDMGPDYDDVGAIAIMHALADSGYAHILATIASNKYEGVASVMNVFNTYYSRPDIPIGVPKGKAVNSKDPQHWTDTILAKYPHKVKRNSQVPDAVELYRKILSSQPDNSVTIVTVGFLTNIARLLETKPDKYSKLNGKELIAKKVKQLIAMAGGFPSGKEFNVFSDSFASKKVFTEWPTPVLFDGFEVGVQVKTGLPLTKNSAINNSPVKDVFSLCIPMSDYDAQGRRSWDEIAVLIAIKGTAPWFTVKHGQIIIHDDGANEWDSNGKGHSYIVPELPLSLVEDIINKLMMYTPVK